MIKFLGKPAITFSEFPDEISLNFNITNCPGNCSHCSEPELLADVGEEITEELLDKFIKDNPGITMIGFMGGDRDHKTVYELSKYIKSKGLKVGIYSGQEYLDLNLLQILDYYKIGRWIMPTGNPDDWPKLNCGPLIFPFSNQLMFKKEDNKWINITNKFRKEPINNLERYIIK